MPSEGGPRAWPEDFAATRKDRRALLVLSALRGITARKLLEVASRVGTASACLAEVRGGRAGSETDRRFAARVGADDLASGLRACGARFVAWGDEEYPPQLGQIHDPPAALFVRGAGLPRIDVAVAVVGARTCSDLGREIARSIGGGLAASGITVVSGAARGIDAAAHEGALAAGGRTVAALGCGIDQTYPRGSRALIERIADAGALISEYPPGVPPEPFRFPARNRIVAGLAGATVVVEGAPGSGSLITGDHALEFGRDVYAVPGAVTNPLASVPLELIREGATMIRGVEDLLLDLKLDGDGGPARRADVSLIEQAALDLLAERVLPERIARGMGLSVAEVIPILMSLEMKGLVRGVGGRYEPTLAAARPGGEPARP